MSTSKEMKKIVIIFLAVASLCGCSSFLNVDTLGKSTIKGFFSDEDGMRSAGIGLHSIILDFMDDEYTIYGELAGDKMNLKRVNANESVIKIFDFDNLAEDVTGYPANIWKSAYEICTNANNILYYGNALIEKRPESKSLVEKHFAYAYFARAYAHFCLVNIYAQPYRYTPDASHPGVVIIDYIPGFDSRLERTSVAKCYSKIIEDLKTAIDLFGDISCPDPNYINGLACEALLARVYLYMGKYQEAADCASKVIAEKGVLTPRDKYVNMFRKAQEVAGEEAILRLNSFNTTSTLGNKCDPTRSNNELEPTDGFFNSFESNDIRKELYTYYAEVADGEEFEGLVANTCCKYIPFKDGVADEMTRRCDPVLLRTSEMYLIRAEALCHIPGADLEVAENDVKAIRARALGRKVEDIKLYYTGAEGLERIVMDERVKELYLEGHRFFDLKRRGENIVREKGTTSTLKLLAYPDYRFALPINQTELEANVYMIQNEGYNGRKEIEE